MKILLSSAERGWLVAGMRGYRPRFSTAHRCARFFRAAMRGSALGRVIDGSHEHVDKWRDLVHNMGVRVMVTARGHPDAHVAYRYSAGFAGRPVVFRDPHLESLLSELMGMAWQE
jgi:hypothetical protein